MNPNGLELQVEQAQEGADYVYNLPSSQYQHVTFQTPIVAVKGQRNQLSRFLVHQLNTLSEEEEPDAGCQFRPLAHLVHQWIDAHKDTVPLSHKSSTVLYQWALHGVQRNGACVDHVQVSFLNEAQSGRLKATAEVSDLIAASMCSGMSWRHTGLTRTKNQIKVYVQLPEESSDEPKSYDRLMVERAHTMRVLTKLLWDERKVLIHWQALTMRADLSYINITNCIRQNAQPVQALEATFDFECLL